MAHIAEYDFRRVNMALKWILCPETIVMYNIYGVLCLKTLTGELANYIVGLTNTDPRTLAPTPSAYNYNVCGPFSGTQPDLGPMPATGPGVDCSYSTPPGRCLIIQRRTTDYLAVAEVKSGKKPSLRFRNTRAISSKIIDRTIAHNFPCDNRVENLRFWLNLFLLTDFRDDLRHTYKCVELSVGPLTPSRLTEVVGVVGGGGVM